jgi:hypothetical protein
LRQKKPFERGRGELEKTTSFIPCLNYHKITAKQGKITKLIEAKREKTWEKLRNESRLFNIMLETED